MHNNKLKQKQRLGTVGKKFLGNLNLLTLAMTLALNSELGKYKSISEFEIIRCADIEKIMLHPDSYITDKKAQVLKMENTDIAQ